MTFHWQRKGRRTQTLYDVPLHCSLWEALRPVSPWACLQQLFMPPFWQHSNAQDYMSRLESFSGKTESILLGVCPSRCVN